ncbi:MAG: response regulator [Spirochaetia bacterium]|nr:response regulator [Spirochaetia bacterium]
MPKKTVLIIDESDLFRQYMKGKLERFGFRVETAINGLDGAARIREVLPDLVVLDYHVTRRPARDVLADKKADPNTAAAPVLLTAQKIDKRRLLELMPFNIRKVFTKPIRIDAFYAALSELLGTPIEVDATPCILEAHVNDDIVFVEIAQGLNREKIDLLRFKIAELLELYAIRKPRVILLMSDLSLSFVDGANLEALLSTVVEASGAKHRHIRVITNEKFVRDFVVGRQEFRDIEVVSNLQYALDGLLAEIDPGSELEEGKAHLVADRVLRAQSGSEGKEALEMRFGAERPRDAKSAPDIESLREAWKDLRVAVVDDDFVTQELVRTVFERADAEVSAFGNGREFLEAIGSSEFDLVFLDLLMPEKNGFDVLAELHARDLDLPVIVLSAVSQREAVVRAFQAGVRSYLVKPMGPDEMVRKTLEVLKANF